MDDGEVHQRSCTSPTDIEVKEMGIAFDGSNLYTTSLVDTDLNGSEIQETLTNISPSTGYHWRMRINYKSNNTLQSYSQWMYGSSYFPTESHVFGPINTVDNDNDGYADYIDCNDNDHATNPGAPEIWYNGVDNNCDGLSDYDQDGDGEDALASGGTDCNDTDASINSSGVEVWYDGVDQNCDGLSDFDQDMDGADSDAYNGTDCDDTTATIDRI